MGGGAAAGGGLDGLPTQQTGYQEQRNHHHARPQVGQDELGQQGDGAPAGVAQVAAHANDAVESSVDERACIEAVCGEGLFGMALRTVAGAVAIGVSQALGILLQRPGEWV